MAVTVEAPMPQQVSSVGLGNNIPSAPPSASTEVLICVGDLHGQVDNFLALWHNLEQHLGPAFHSAKVLFLGDFVDRGPDPHGMIDWLISAPAKYPRQQHAHLMGNHDFACASFLGLIPVPPGHADFRWTWEDQLRGSLEREGWWKGEHEEENFMHLQGRRWGGMIGEENNSTYDSANTFRSYGVEHGDREGLLKAMPESHKEFLRNLPLVYEDEIAGEKVIAVHAGLATDSDSPPVSEQLDSLRKRDLGFTRSLQLSGRGEVYYAPKEFENTNTVVISGHHGCVYVGKNRIIMDESGGHVTEPLSAVVLPSRKIISHNNYVMKV
eukprot:jgi/Chlat1/4079/Chrsp26S04116